MVVQASFPSQLQQKHGSSFEGRPRGFSNPSLRFHQHFYAVCCLPSKAVELKVNCVQRTASSALRVMVVAKSAISAGSLKPLVDTNSFGLQLAPASTGSRKAQLQCEMKKNSCQWVQGCGRRPLSKSCSRGWIEGPPEKRVRWMKGVQVKTVEWVWVKCVRWVMAYRSSMRKEDWRARKRKFEWKRSKEIQCRVQVFWHFRTLPHSAIKGWQKSMCWTSYCRFITEAVPPDTTYNFRSQLWVAPVPMRQTPCQCRYASKCKMLTMLKGYGRSAPGFLPIPARENHGLSHIRFAHQVEQEGLQSRSFSESRTKVAHLHRWKPGGTHFHQRKWEVGQHSFFPFLSFSCLLTRQAVNLHFGQPFFGLHIEHSRAVLVAVQRLSSSRSHLWLLLFRCLLTHQGPNFHFDQPFFGLHMELSHVVLVALQCLPSCSTHFHTTLATERLAMHWSHSPLDLLHLSCLSWATRLLESKSCGRLTKCWLQLMCPIIFNWT